jgi:phosphoribosylglycinamide formyltransferase 1
LNRAHPLPIVVLISGRGSNMRALIESSRREDAAFCVSQVFSDQAAAAGLATARDLGVGAQAVAYAKGTERSAYDARLAAAIDAHSPALVVLAGFMRILSAPFIERYAGRILNIHPSLLPQYAGLHTHRRVLEAGDAQHGATVHFVTAELDGGPRIIQAQVAVEPDDTEATLSGRVVAQEHRIFPLAVNWYCQGRLRCEADKAWLDGRPLNEPVQYAPAEPMSTS